MADFSLAVKRPKTLEEFIKNGEGTDILKLSSQYFSTGHNFAWFSLGVWK